MKIAFKKLPESSPTAMDVLYLIMLNIDGNVDEKFRQSIFYRSREYYVYLKTFQADILNYKVGGILKILFA